MDRLEESVGVLEEAVEALSEKKKGQSKDQKLKAKFTNPKTGRFKGGKGERFKNCEAYFKAKGGISDPSAMCASIYRRKMGEGVDGANATLSGAMEILDEYKIHGSNKKRVNVLGHDGKKAGRKKMTHGKSGGRGC